MRVRLVDSPRVAVVQAGTRWARPELSLQRGCQHPRQGRRIQRAVPSALGETWRPRVCARAAIAAFIHSSRSRVPGADPQRAGRRWDSAEGVAPPLGRLLIG